MQLDYIRSVILHIYDRELRISIKYLNVCPLYKLTLYMTACIHNNYY